MSETQVLSKSVATLTLKLQTAALEKGCFYWRRVSPVFGHGRCAGVQLLLAVELKAAVNERSTYTDFSLQLGQFMLDHLKHRQTISCSSDEDDEALLVQTWFRPHGLRSSICTNELCNGAYLISRSICLKLRAGWRDTVTKWVCGLDLEWG